MSRRFKRHAKPWPALLDRRQAIARRREFRRGGNGERGRLRKEGRASRPRVAMKRDAEKYPSKRRVPRHLQTELYD